MTLWASRDEHRPEIITVQCTYGPTVFKVEEHQGHVGSFWSSLGRLLAQDKDHAQREAQAAYERYMRHVEATGEEPGEWSWGGLDQAGRDHWVAVVGG